MCITIVKDKLREFGIESQSSQVCSTASFTLHDTAWEKLLSKSIAQQKACKNSSDDFVGVLLTGFHTVPVKLVQEV